MPEFLLAGWRIQPAAGTLERGEVVRRLRPQEMDLLLALVARPGQVVSREELLAAVWRETAVEEGALARTVSLIRKALGDSPREARYIETVPKRGYRLVAEVRPAPVADAPSDSYPPRGSFLRPAGTPAEPPSAPTLDAGGSQISEKASEPGPGPAPGATAQPFAEAEQATRGELPDAGGSVDARDSDDAWATLPVPRQYLAPGIGAPPDATTPEVSSGTPEGRRRAWVVAVVLVALALVGLVLATGIRLARQQLPLSEGTSPEADPEAAPFPLPSELPTVAVPAFRNLARSEEHSWLAEGLAEMIATELALSPEVQLVPRELVSRQRLTPPRGEEAPEEVDAVLRTALGTDLVLLGAFLVEAEQEDGTPALRIDLKLIDGESGQTVTALVQAGSAGNLSRLVQAAGEDLREALQAAPEEARPLLRTGESLPRNPEAIRLYTDGLLLLERFQPAAARENLLRALTLEPNQPYAQLALADALQTLGRPAAAAEAAAAARSLSTTLPPNQRRWIEARSLGLASRWLEAAAIYRQLWNASPANLEYGLDLAGALIEGRRLQQALEVVGELRGRAGSDYRDPRIDLAEAHAAWILGDHPRTVKASGRARDLAEEAGRSDLLARALGLQAPALWKLGRFEEARDRLREAEKLLREDGNRMSMAWLRLTAATWNQQTGKDEDLDGEFEEVRDTFRELGNRKAGAIVELRIARREADRGDLEAATRRLQAAIRTFRELGDTFEEAQALNGLGITFATNGDLARATPAFTEALALYRQVGNRDMEQGALANLARLAMFQGRIEEAARRWDEAYRMALDLDSDSSLAGAQFNRASVWIAAGNPRAAQEGFREAIELYRRLEDPRMLAAALDGLGQVQIATLELRAARRNLEAALELRRELGDERRTAGSYNSLARLALEEGDPSGAEQLARRASEAVEPIPEAATTPLTLLALALAEQGKAQQAWEVLELARTAGGDAFGVGIRGGEQKVIAARVHAGMGRTGEATRLLDEVRKDAEKGGAWQIWAEAELTLGELEIRAGETRQGHVRLAALEAEARRRGLHRLSRRARGLLAGRPSRAGPTPGP